MQDATIYYNRQDAIIKLSTSMQYNPAKTAAVRRLVASFMKLVQVKYGSQVCSSKLRDGFVCHCSGILCI